MLLAASQNEGPLKVFRWRNNADFIPVHADDRYAIIKFQNGKFRRQELYYGSGFLSQSSRFIARDNNVVEVKLANGKGALRLVK